jgi:5'-3' exonuclease
MSRKAKPGVSYSISDIALFLLTAAASGVVGNVAYDALKAFVARLGKTEERLFEEIIIEEEYESQRIATHTINANGSEITTETERIITRRHTILNSRSRDAGKRLT